MLFLHLNFGIAGHSDLLGEFLVAASTLDLEVEGCFWWDENCLNVLGAGEEDDGVERHYKKIFFKNIPYKIYRGLP